MQSSMATGTFTSSLKLLYREALRSPWIVSALRGEDPEGDDQLTVCGGPVLILGGLFSRPFYYAPLGRMLRRRGYDVHFDADTFNVRPFRPHVAELRARVCDIVEATGRPVRLLGHSLGGLHAMALLADAPEHVGQVIAIASPIVGGTPWQPLQQMAERLLDVRGTETDGLRERTRAHVARVTTISSPRDMVAPPQACAIDGARNVVLSTVPPRDESLASHGGVIFMRTAVRVVLASLARPLVGPPVALPRPTSTQPH
jgi:pimeloyl-ACP methyl ester carboxylesterase